MAVPIGAGMRLTDIKTNIETADVGLTVTSLRDAIENDAIESSYDVMYFIGPSTSQREFQGYNHHIDDYGIDGPSYICAGESVNLCAYGLGGSYFLWNTGETTICITVSPTETTTFRVTISNGNTVKVASVTIIVNNCINFFPIVPDGNSFDICAGEEITIYAAGLGDLGWTEFLWSTGYSGQFADTPTPKIVVSPYSTTTTYHITVSNQTSIDTFYVTINIVC